jgi:gliding motility-associated-like protein
MNRFIKFYIILLFSLNIKAQVPSATIIVPGPVRCSGHQINLTAFTTNSPTAYSWSVSPSASVIISPDNISPSVNVTFPKGGVYLISLQVSNATGTTVTTKTLSITQSAKASFDASLTTVGFPNQMILTNYSSNGVSNLWIYNDAPFDNAINTVKNYTSSGSYTIKLIEYGSVGCNDTSMIYSFRIADSSGITVPNIFTPNDDDVNDLFKPIAAGIQTMNAWIYNRYGTLIYNWDKPKGFWDGYTTSGEPCAPGVYFYVIEASGFDGKSYKLRGKVNLFR